jgi:O-antigen ligase
VYGLLIALLFATIERRKAWLIAIAAIACVHVVATTSIKANLGILLGAAVVTLAHFGTVWRLFWRHALVILVMVGALGFAIASSPAAMTTIERGTDRVALGLRVLQAREDLPGYGGFAKRTNWQTEGLRGWAANPVFGHGVEAFRSQYGITSHASHVDLLYNSGLIGAALFYGVFASVLLRLYRARNGTLRVTRLVILGGVACYFFTSFAGTVHYLASLGAFLALSVGILRRA